ncbi:MAG: BTAD domain-containing putative transcriptional regulator [Anaerolineae bacterium]|nr:BTAD domain-containing putative transcriptional regulator [Anaerolineae bacterium]
MSHLKLFLLGAPRVERDGVALQFDTRKAIALLAYLALGDQSFSRDTLAALFWPEYEQSQARNGLRRTLSVLIKGIGPGLLDVDRETVALRPDNGLWVDVAQCHQHLAACQTHGHLPEETCPECLSSLSQALNLYRGDFMAGFNLRDASEEFETWQLFQTEHLRRQIAIILEKLISGHVAQGELEPAFTYGRRWLALDPLDETAHRHLMRLHAWIGQPAAALQQYQACVRILEQEVGLPPSPETTALVEAIKNNRLPPPVVTEPKRAATGKTTLPDPAKPPHNLPIQATPFIGRESTLDGLQQRLADPAVRLITIVGPGGVGKTRLALAVAERQLKAERQPTAQLPFHPAPVFSDGIYFISLAPIRSAEAIVQTIAEGLAFPLVSAEEPVTQLLTYLRHKQMLLVLDNFEHVLAGAALVSQILQTAAGVKVVVTSRERLNLVHEALWPIGGLNFERLASLEEALTYDAVQLFLQRAHQVQPNFSLQAEALPHLERILQTVWGMPLAIELAAAWLNMLSVAEIAAELSRGLDLLGSELQDVPGRHRSMRLVFDRSWERLDEEEQALFKRLSIFRGGFTREAAQQVAEASLRGLAGLVNKSLLTSRPNRGRYELHELLRQYAEEKLEADGSARAAVQQAHAAFYADFMQQSWTNLRSAKQLTALAAIEQDIENIRAAWRYYLAEQNSAELLKFMDSFWMVYDIRGWHQAAIKLFEEAAGQLRPASADDVAALVCGKALGYAGYYIGIVGDPERGLALSNEAIDLIRPLNHPQALLYILYLSAVIHLYLGNFDQVIEVAQTFGRMGQETGDRWAEASALSILATALVSRQNVAEAQDKTDQALQIFTQEIGEYFSLTWAALVRGRVALAQGAYAEAKLFYEQSLKAAKVLNYRRTTQQSYDNLGDVSFYLGQLGQAEQYFRLSLEISEETGQTREMLATLYDLARVRAAQGNKAEAVELLAVVLHHPLSNLPLLLRTEDSALKEAATRLLATLEVELDPDVYGAAWSQGRIRHLEEIVAGFLR